MDDEEIRQTAIEFAKRNKMKIARELTDRSIFPSEDLPISVFMAGSPGAGKTEFSKTVIAILEEGRERRVIRIDGDEIRSRLPGYEGSNSHLFQKAIIPVVEKIHDLALHQKQNFVLDGTFASYDVAKKNIQRSLKEERPIFVFYLYQAPQVAWTFTQGREVDEGRRILKQTFIYQFIGARETVEKVLEEFNEKITVFLVKKDFEKNDVEDIVKLDLKGKGIDDIVKERYTKDLLEQLL